MDKRRLGTAIARYSLNPLVKALAGIGPLPFGMALLETVGRKSGEPRRLPVGGRLRNGAFWFVAEHGRRAAYVRNIVANPRVRVKVGCHWLAGTAVLLDEDDAVKRTHELGLRLNGAIVRTIGTEPLSVRIDLHPDG
jgi:deazaflavin-dependent oxidoreductase (nitroreductase family)